MLTCMMGLKGEPGRASGASRSPQLVRPGLAALCRNEHAADRACAFSLGDVLASALVGHVTGATLDVNRASCVR